MTLYRLARGFLFRMDPEDAHHFVMRRLVGLSRGRVLRGLLERWLSVPDPRLATRVFGLDFRNPVGLAAGLDKHGEAAAAWAALGFGFAEIGSVTALAQDGNPRPRVFRVPEAAALINRMGFNSVGAEAAAENLARAGKQSIPIGVNLGRSRVTPNEQAAADYCKSVAALWRHADYFAVNVSSPNTPGLRELQRREPLCALLATVRGKVSELALGAGAAAPPVLVKLAPDLASDELDDALAAALDAGVQGLIVSNTTLARDGVEGSPHAGEAGGLSGAPLRARSTTMIRAVRERISTRLPIIGVGGIASAADAYEKIRAGASLIQIYTGLIYQGPTLARAINRGLARLLARDGFAHAAEAVGQ